MHEIILTALSCTGFYLFDTLYAALEPTNLEIQTSCLHPSQLKMKPLVDTYRSGYLLLILKLEIQISIKLNQQKQWSGAPDEDVHNAISLLIS